MLRHTHGRLLSFLPLLITLQTLDTGVLCLFSDHDMMGIWGYDRIIFGSDLHLWPAERSVQEVWRHVAAMKNVGRAAPINSHLGCGCQRAMCFQPLGDDGILWAEISRLIEKLGPQSQYLTSPPCTGARGHEMWPIVAGEQCIADMSTNLREV